jgi:membrane-bound lytic murein transglycosylase B
MNYNKPAAPAFALSRLRLPLATAALAAALSIAPASAQMQAQTQAPASTGTLIAQAQPQQPAPQGQTFEEEIVPQRYASNAKVDAFINEMAGRNNFDPERLHALFARVSYSATAVKLVTPAASPSVKNWRVYRSRFIEPIRINAGVKFWRANQATLQRASEEFGVPPKVIVGIIGVETIYGRYMGNFRVLDALTTLTFDYPDTANL